MSKLIPWAGSKKCFFRPALHIWATRGPGPTLNNQPATTTATAFNARPAPNKPNYNLNQHA